MSLHKLLTPLLLLAVCQPLAAQGKWARGPLAGNAVESYRKKFQVPGMAVAIAKNGKIIYAKGFGYKNAEKKIKASTLTRFRLASVSKPVSAILAMELVDQKKLNLYSYIRSILTPKAAVPLHHQYTVRDLLCHQSGVRHYKSGSDPTKGVSKHYTYVSHALKLFFKDKLVAKPRTKYSYTTHGFSVLGAVVEKKTGKSFRLHANTRFKAWGLHYLAVENAPISEFNRSQIYKREKGKNKVSKRDDLSWKAPGGGMHSNVLDMCKLGMMLCDGKILKKKTRDDMWTRRKTKDGKTTGYGLGWGVGWDSAGRKVAAHSGSQNGANSYWRIYPKEKIVVIVLSNRSGHKPADLGRYLAALALSSKGKPIPTW